MCLGNPESAATWWKNGKLLDSSWKVAKLLLFGGNNIGPPKKIII